MLPERPAHTCARSTTCALTAHSCSDPSLPLSSPQESPHLGQKVAANDGGLELQVALVGWDDGPPACHLQPGEGAVWCGVAWRVGGRVGRLVLGGGGVVGAQKAGAPCGRLRLCVVTLLRRVLPAICYILPDSRSCRQPSQPRAHQPAPARWPLPI